MIEQLAERAAMRGMNPMEFLRWRNDLRQDYQQTFDPPAHRPATALPYGTLFVALDPPPWPYEALVMVSELPNPATGSWAEWASMPESWRVRGQR